jgi:hypothetical protein
MYRLEGAASTEWIDIAAEVGVADCDDEPTAGGRHTYQDSATSTGINMSCGIRGWRYVVRARPSTAMSDCFQFLDGGKAAVKCRAS